MFLSEGRLLSRQNLACNQISYVTFYTFTTTYKGEQFTRGLSTTAGLQRPKQGGHRREVGALFVPRQGNVYPSLLALNSLRVIKNYFKTPRIQ